MAYSSTSRGADGVLLSQKDYDAVQKYKADWTAANAAGDTAGMAAAHDGAQAIRAKYGYSGGEDGGAYLRLDETEENPWRAGMEGAVRALMGREAFSYDPEEDPLYQSYVKQYAREGSRAAEDALGRAAVMTGGMPSTAAVTAASQAGDYYAAKTADKVPELWSLAWNRYRDEDSRLRDDLSLLMSMEKSEYDRGRREREWAYQQQRDAVSDQRWAEQQAAAAEEKSYQKQLNKARTLAAAGDFSGYAALGWSEAELASLQNHWNVKNAPKGGSYRSVGSAEGSGGEESAETPAFVAAAAKTKKRQEIDALLSRPDKSGYAQALRLIGELDDEDEQRELLRGLDRALRERE